MFFSLLGYLQPTHYFHKQMLNGTTIFPKPDYLPESIKKQLEVDSRFMSSISQDYDVSWQAVQRGYIGDALRYRDFDTVPLVDAYRFIRKYFHPGWVLYVLLIRLLSFKSPVREVKSYFNSKNVKRCSLTLSPLLYSDYFSFESLLINERPLVTVIIPTLNRYPYLKDVFRDLEQQSYKHFEVFVVDQTEVFDVSVYEGWNLNLRFWQQEEKALWLARNEAIKHSKAQYLLLYDDDSRVDPDWILQHLKALDYFNADISSGVSLSVVGADIPQNYSYFRISDQLDTGNVLVKRTVFESIGLFDRQFERQRMGDGEFGLRAFIGNFLNVSNPHAKRIHLKVGSGGLRDMGSWDAFYTQNLLEPRPVPSVLYYFRQYFGNSAARLALLKSVPLSLLPYRYKNNKIYLIIGALLGLLIVPLVLFQVFKSWRLASKKISLGARIEELIT